MTKLYCEDAQGMAAQHPDTFEVASIATLQDVVRPGVYAKICVLDGQFQGERIWTDIVECDGVNVKATLANDPMGLKLKHGDPVEFQLRHIYNVTDHEGNEIA